MFSKKNPHTLIEEKMTYLNAERTGTMFNREGLGRWHLHEAQFTQHLGVVHNGGKAPRRNVQRIPTPRIGRERQQTGAPRAESTSAAAKRPGGHSQPVDGLKGLGGGGRGEEVATPRGGG